MSRGPEQGFWCWLADGLQRFIFVCGKNYPCEVFVKLCHMFSAMKILLKQNIEAKGSAKETKSISKFFDMKLRVQHLLDTVKFLFLEPHSLRGRSSKGKGQGIRARVKLPFPSLSNACHAGYEPFFFPF